MWTSAIAAAAASFMALPVSALDNVFVVTIGVLAMGRMDPIVTPGKPAPHVHTIFGASNFRSVLNTPQEQQNAACTTVNVASDKPSYWVP